MKMKNWVLKLSLVGWLSMTLALPLSYATAWSDADPAPQDSNNGAGFSVTGSDKVTGESLDRGAGQSGTEFETGAAGNIGPGGEIEAGGTAGIPRSQDGTQGFGGAANTASSGGTAQTM